MQLTANAESRSRSLTADHDRALTRLRVLEFLLQCHRVFGKLAERTFEHTELALHGVRVFHRPVALDERGAREIIASLSDGDFGLPIPLAGFLPEPLATPRELLLVGDRARGGSA